MDTLHFSHPDYLKEFPAYRDLKYKILNLRKIEYLQQEIKLIDEAITKYTLDNETMALGELKIIREFARTELDFYLRYLSFPNRNGSGYLSYPSQNKEVNIISDIKDEIEELRQEIDDLKSEI